MSLVVVTGDVSTTMTVALACGWPRPAVIVEADPRGGVLASWFGLPTSPSLSDAVIDRDGAILDHVQQGLCRVLLAPQRSIEASASIIKAERDLVDRLGRLEDDHGHRIDVIIDSGGPAPARVLVPGADRADVLVVTHRQRRGTRPEAAVRIAQMVERIDALGMLTAHVVCAVVGRRPYGIGEIAAVLAPVPVYAVPTDRRSARLIAGRAGFLGRRRSRLVRAAGRIAESIVADSIVAVGDSAPVRARLGASR